MRLGLVWAKQRKKCLGQLGPENRRMEAIPPPLPPPRMRRALSLQGDETALPFGASVGSVQRRDMWGHAWVSFQVEKKGQR